MSRPRPAVCALRAVALLALLGLAGCPTPFWARVETAPAASPDGSFSTDLPVGWVRLQRAKDRLVVTRDGLPLQLIELWRRDPAKAFPALKKGAAAGMLPEELAQLEAADFARAEGPQIDVQVVENAPATVAGRPGFRLLLRERTGEGLRFLIEMYGVADAGGYYTFTYQAPELYYFERDHPAFQAVLARLRILRVPRAAGP